jgi:hypothetical protein
VKARASYWGTIDMVRLIYSLRVSSGHYRGNGISIPGEPRSPSWIVYCSCMAWLMESKSYRISVGRLLMYSWMPVDTRVGRSTRRARVLSLEFTLKSIAFGKLPIQKFRLYPLAIFMIWTFIQLVPLLVPLASSPNISSSGGSSVQGLGSGVVLAVDESK